MVNALEPGLLKYYHFQNSFHSCGIVHLEQAKSLDSSESIRFLRITLSTFNHQCLVVKNYSKNHTEFYLLDFGQVSVLWGLNILKEYSVLCLECEMLSIALRI